MKKEDIRAFFKKRLESDDSTTGTGVGGAASATVTSTVAFHSPRTDDRDAADDAGTTNGLNPRRLDDKKVGGADTAAASKHEV